MTKLSAMVRYEVLMAWRRRSLPILWILLLVGVIGFALLVAKCQPASRRLWIRRFRQAPTIRTRQTGRRESIWWWRRTRWR